MKAKYTKAQELARQLTEETFRNLPQKDKPTTCFIFVQEKRDKYSAFVYADNNKIKDVDLREYIPVIDSTFRDFAKDCNVKPFSPVGVIHTSRASGAVEIFYKMEEICKKNKDITVEELKDKVKEEIDEMVTYAITYDDTIKEDVEKIIKKRLARER